jgi:hypothetical protein
LRHHLLVQDLRFLFVTLTFSHATASATMRFCD